MANKNDLLVITAAGGFIAGTLVRYFHDRGFTRIRAVDKKPLFDWYQRVPGVECLALDVSQEETPSRRKTRTCGRSRSPTPSFKRLAAAGA